MGWWKEEREGEKEGKVGNLVLKASLCEAEKEKERRSEQQRDRKMGKERKEEKREKEKRRGKGERRFEFVSYYF